MGFDPNSSWAKQAIEKGLIPDVGKSDSPGAYGTQSAGGKAPEAEDVQLVLWAVEQAGFGKPVPEHRFHETRKWRFDWAWPAEKVALEREGGVWKTVGDTRILMSRHRTEGGYDADCEKYNAAQVSGWVVIRATPKMLSDGRALVALLEALSRRKGEPLPDSIASGKASAG